MPRPGLPVLVRALGIAALFAISRANPAHAAVIRDNLYDVKAIGPAEGWAVGNFGAIYHTTDGGKSWDARDSGTKLPLFGVDFADADHGWVVGKTSLVLATADGGKTWKTQKSAIPPEKHLFKVRAVDARTAWAVGDWGAVQVTHDGGETWEDRSLTEDIVLYDVSFPDAQHGFIAGEYGTVMATSDGGTSWQKQQVGTDKTLFGISFATPEKGWVVGIDGLIVRTTDGGRTWSVQRGASQAEAIEELGFLETLKNPGLYTVQVVGKYGIVAGDTGIILTSGDGGETWTRRELPDKERLVWMRGVSLVPGTHGFVVGSAGFSAAIDGEQVTVPGGGKAHEAHIGGAE